MQVASTAPGVLLPSGRDGSHDVYRGSQEELLQPRERVLELLRQGAGTYDAGELNSAVEALVKRNPTPSTGSEAMVLGQGTWQVFHAPHIANMSSALQTRFEPIQYVLTGDVLLSNVKYSNPLIGEGWLSAGGTMGRKYDNAVEVHFDRFWFDVGSAYRPDIGTADAPATAVDDAVGALGRAAFFPQFAIFPVLYVDPDLAVFEFPPLKSKIAVRKIA